MPCRFCTGRGGVVQSCSACDEGIHRGEKYLDFLGGRYVHTDCLFDFLADRTTAELIELLDVEELTAGED